MPGCRAEYRQKFKIKGFRFGGGETTQRIAAALFQAVQRYKYGIHFASFYLPGDFVPHVRIMNTATSQFLSTPSARRATSLVRLYCSIRSDFYPRPPRGGRLGVGHGVGHHIDISIHALREEGDKGLERLREGA